MMNGNEAINLTGDNKRILLEAWSFYRHELNDVESLTVQAQRAIEVANSIRNQIESEAVSVSTIVLLDDIEPGKTNDLSEKEVLRLTSMLSILQSGLPTGFDLVLESSFVSQGMDLARQAAWSTDEYTSLRGVAASGVPKTKKSGEMGSRLRASGDKIEVMTRDRKTQLKLKGKDGDKTLPSCDVLDFCMYRWKLTQADLVLTVLPLSMQPQQARVKELFVYMEGRLPRGITVVYYNDKTSDIELIDDWAQ